MKKILCSAIVTAIALTGCASFIQTKNASFKEINTGISYYLPKRMHRLVVTAENLNAEEEKQKFEVAETLFKTKDKVAKDFEAEWRKLSAEADNTPVGINGANIDAKAEAIKKAQTAEGVYLAAKTFANDARVNMEKAKSRYDQASAKENSAACNYYITMDITPQPLQPDTDYPFLLKLNSSPLRDEDLKITTTNSGLLSSVDVISADRTGDIAVEIAKIVAMVVGGFPTPLPTTKPFFLSPERTEGRMRQLPCYQFILKHDEIIDFKQSANINGTPIIFRDRNGFIPTGHALPPPLSVSISINDKKISDLEKIYEKQELKEDQDIPSILKGYYGILYRRDATYLVELKNENNLVASRQISMPNLSPVSLLPYKYLPLATTTNKATFENGMLLTYDTNQPSSVLALAQLPAKVVEGYIQALTSFLQLKIDYSSKEISALGKEKELADALKSLQDTLKKQNP